MKKGIIVLSFLVGILFIGKAQGNLQFKEVLNQTFSGTSQNNRIIAGSITVPTGEVWKVVTASITIDGGTGFYYDYSVTTTYGNQGFIGDNIVYSNKNTSSLLPLWLGAGTYSVDAFMVSVPFKFSISAIKFSVVP